jgi:hypothetical protein
MPVRRAAEHPVALATPSTIIARITIAGIITPRSIGRRYTPIISLIGKLDRALEGKCCGAISQIRLCLSVRTFSRETLYVDWRLRMGTSRNAFAPENVARHEDVVSDSFVADTLQSARLAHTFNAGAPETRFVSACQ